MKRVKNNNILSKNPVVLEASKKPTITPKIIKKSAISPKSQAPAPKIGQVSKGPNARNNTSVPSVPSVSSSASYLKPELLTIHQVSEKLGVATKTLRRWEAKGVIKPQRTIGNQRRYTLADIEALKTGANHNSKVSKGTKETVALVSSGSSVSSSALGTKSPVAGKRYFVSSGAGLGPSANTSSSAGSKPTRLTPDQAATKFDLDRSRAKKPAMNPEASRRVHVHDNVQFSKNNPTESDRKLNRKLISLSMLLGVLSFGVISAIIGGLGFFPSLFLNSNKIISKDQAGNVTEASARNVLGDSTKIKRLTGELFINIPTIMNADLAVNANVVITGKLTAPNIVYDITAGSNIAINGDPQHPKISTGPIVTSLAGKTGELKLAAGTGVTINGLEIGLKSDQVTVTAGNGLSGGGPVKLGGSISLENDGVVTLTGTANQIEVSASKGDVTVSLSPNAQTTSLTLTGLTPGSVVFAGPGGLLSQNNANFFWDDTTKRLGLGTSTPTATLDIAGTALFKNTADSTAAFLVQNSAGTWNLAIDTANQRLGIGTTAPTATLDVAGASLVSGVATFTHAPTLAHLFAPWPTGTSNGTDASVYINPASSVADGNLLVAAVGGVAKFAVDAEGDVYANNFILTGSVSSGTTNIAGDLNVSGNTTLGDAPTDTITLNGRVSSNIIPSVDNTYNLGSAILRWANLYATTVNSTTVNSTTVNATNINGAITPTGFTQGSVAFAGAGGTLTQNNANFFWDDTNTRLGIGTTVPSSKLQISDGNAVNSSLITNDYVTIAAQNTAPGFSIISAGSTAGQRAVFKGVRSGGTLGSPTVPNVDDSVLSFLGAIYDGSITQGTAMVGFTVDGAVSAGIAPQRIGFFTSSTDATSRTEKLTIKSNGNVGIGTTTPSDKLDVNGIIRVATLGTANTATNLCRNASNQIAPCNTTGTGAAFVQDGNSFGSLATLGTNDAFDLAFETSGVEKVRILTNGNVGIGTTAPGFNLDVVGADAAESALSTTAAGAAPVLQMFRSNGTAATRTQTLSGDIIFDLRGRGHTGSAFAGGPSVEIRGLAAENISGSGNGGSLAFMTTPIGSLSLATRMTINPAGNVGIGTTAPLSKLDVNGGTAMGTYAGVNAAPTNGLIVSGNVGIGTTTPSSFKLEVAGNVGPEADNTRDLGSAARRWANIYGTTINATTVNATTFAGAVTPSGFTQGSVVFAGSGGTLTQDNPNFFWDDTNNRLGIGTTSPLTRLEVVEVGTTSSLRGILISQYNDGLQAPLLMTQKARGTLAAPAGIQTGDYIFGTQAVGYSSAGSFSSPKSLILSAATENWSGTGQGYDLRFFTAAIGVTGTGTERLRIDSSGNVGIGTTAPADKLDVNGIIRVATLGAANTATHLCRNASNQLADCNTTGTGANFIQDGNSFGALATLGTNDAFGLAFETSGVEKVRILTNGNVGIGTAVPTGKLDVRGIGLFGTSDLSSIPGRLVIQDSAAAGNSLAITTNSNPGSSILGINFIDRINGTSQGAEGQIGTYVRSERIGSGAAFRLLFGTSDGVDLAADAVTKMTIDSTGNVGIGTTTPLSKLDINGGTAIGTYAGVNTAPTNGLIVSGNVGIGTTTPTSFKLETAGSIGPTVDNTYDLGSASKRWANIYGTTINATTVNATTFAGAITPTGFTQGSVAFAGAGGTLTQNNSQFFWDNTNNRLGLGTSAPGATLEVGGAGANDGRLLLKASGPEFDIYDTTEALDEKNYDFVTGTQVLRGRLVNDANSAATTWIEVKRSGINVTNVNFPNGNVGIGTTGPTSRLDVLGASGSSAAYNAYFKQAITAASTILGIENSAAASTSNGARIDLRALTDSTVRNILSIDATHSVIADATRTSKVVFTTNDNGVATTPLTLLGGNVGIGTTTPTSFKLEVAGNIGPEADNTRDLGSATRRWANIYGTNIAGTVTPTGFTQGSVVFAGTGGTLTQNNANFFWDNTNSRLGIGTTAPAFKLDVVDNTNVPVRFSRTGADILQLYASGGTVGNAPQLAFTVLDSAAGNPTVARLQGLATSLTSGAVTGGLEILTRNAGTQINAMSILGNGNVGIGTTAPADKLDVSGIIRVATLGTANTATHLCRNASNQLADCNTTGTGANFIQDGNSFGALATLGTNDAFGLAFETSGVEKVRILTNGNVGIGTTAPGSLLHIAQDGAAALNLILAKHSTDTVSSVFTGRKSRGTQASPLDVANGDFLAEFNAQAYSGGYLATSSLDIFVDGTFTSGQRPPTGISLWTNAANTSAAERLRITSGGNVGIGTTAPAAKLEVKNNGAPQLFITDNTVGTSASPNTFGMRFRGWNDVEKAAIYATDESSNFSRGQLAFYTQDNGGSLTEKLRISHNGNVGIGTTSPAALFSVGTTTASNFKVNSQGDVTSSFVTLDGSSTANGAGTSSTTLIVTSGTNFDVGNYVNIASTSCVTGVNSCYAKITAKSVNTLTISPALTWATASVVTEVHIPEVGGTDLAQTLTNRYGRGYFIDGIVAGNGSTYYSDGSILQAGAGSTFNLLNNGNTTAINIGTSATTTTIPGTLNVSGSGTSTYNGDITISKANPALIYDASTAGDTDFWAGVRNDGGGTSNDTYQIGGGTTPGTTPYLTVNASGNVGIGTTAPSSLFSVGSTSQFQVNSSGQVTYVDGTTNTATAVCKNASGQLASCNTTGTGAAFVQDGNSFGALATLGTNDAFGLAFETSGVEKVRILTNGNVGIGTTAPTQKLQVAGQVFFSPTSASFDPGDSSGAGIRIGYSTGGDYGYINASNTGVANKNLLLQPNGGNVGIGTTAPGILLDLASTTASDGIRLTVDNAGGPGGFTFRKTGGSGGIVVSGGGLGQLIWRGNDGGGASSFKSAAQLDVLVDGTPSTTSMPGAMRFLTTPSGSTTPTERMRIDSSGNVGIGTSTPNSFKLEIAGNVGPEADNTRDLGSATRRWANIFGTTINATTVNATTFAGAITPTGFTQGSVVFAGASGTLTQNNANFFWDNTNNRLGIGTSAPSANLHTLATTFGTHTSLLGTTFTSANLFEQQITSSAFTSPFQASSFEAKADLASDPGSKAINGIKSLVVVPSTNSTTQASLTLRGGNFDAEHLGTGSLGTLIGLQGVAVKAGTGSVAQAIGLNAGITNSNATGTLTDARGVFISGLTNTGTVTNTYGLYIDPQTAGVQTNAAYAIYQASASDKNYFAGNVGIGTTAPAQTLQIHKDGGGLYLSAGNTSTTHIYFGNGTATSQYLRQKYDNTTGNFTLEKSVNGQFTDTTNLMTVLWTSGNVGIGTTTPTSFKLEVAGNIGPEADNTRDLGSATRRWANIFGTTINATTVNATTFAGAITPTGFTQGSVVFAGASGTLTQNNANFFWDNTNARLGIGTSSPAQPLHVSGAAQIGAAGSGATNGQIFLNRGTTTNLGLTWYNTGDSARWATGLVADSTDNFAISTDGTASGAKIYIQRTSGNVGIGTTNPTQALSVNGNIQIKANGTTRYILTDETNTGTTQLILQSGAGSAGYGGAINLYGHANASKPGWVTAGISATSGTVGTATEGRFTVNDQALGAGADLFTVLRTGNVGIGTTAPGALLDVAGSGAGTLNVARLQNTVAAANNSGSQLLFAANRTTTGLTNIAGVSGLITDITDAAYKGALVFSTSNNGVPAERVRIDNLGAMGIGTTAPTAGQKLHISSATQTQATIENTSGLGDVGLRFKTTSAEWMVGQNIGSAGTGKFNIYDFAAGNRLTIDTAGNVGIGTTAPAAMLDISQGNVNGLRLGADFNATTRTDSTLKAAYFSLPHYTNAQLNVSLIIGSSSSTANSVAIGGGTSSQNAATVLQFLTGATTTTTGGTERMRIDSNGNVGIGTTVPSSKLHVLDTRTDTSGTAVGSLLRMTANPTSASTANFYGAENFSVFGGTASTTGILIGAYNLSQQGAGSGVNVAAAYGAYNQGTVAGAGTATNITGSYNIASIAATGTGNVTNAQAGRFAVLNSSTTSTITNSYGVWVDAPVNSGGTITSNFGTRIFNQGLSSIATSYGLYIDAQSGSTSNSYAAIFAGGNVGIGTTAPLNKLSVGSAVTATDFSTPIAQFTGTSYAAGAFYGIGFNFAGTNAVSPVALGYIPTLGTANTKGALVFATRDTTTGGDVPSERMRIDSAGNVGIGTTAPAGLLDVSKAISATPSLTGKYLSLSASTLTDSGTAGSGTLANAVFNSIAAPTLAATNTLVTTTNAYTMYIAGAPIAGTNETLTNSIALGINTGAAGNKGLVIQAAASQTADLLQLLDSSGGTQGSITALGTFRANGGTTAATAYGFTNDATTGLILTTGGSMGLVGNGTEALRIRPTVQYLWVSPAADNTTAATGIAFGLSRDTNLYRSAASILKTDGSFVIEGDPTAASSKALELNNSGAVTGTGYGGYFTKTGASTTNVGLYATATGATNNYAAIFEAGNVGIGTTSPTNLVTIASNVASLGLEVDRFTTTTSSSPGIQISKSNSGTIGNQVLNSTADAEIGKVIFAPSNGSAFVTTAGMFGYTGTGGHQSTTDLPTYLTFKTTPDGSSTLTERLRIAEDGNVGIGTTAPAYLFDVSKSQNTNTTIQVTNANGGAAAFSNLQAASTGGTAYLYQFGGSYTTSGRNIQSSALLDASGTGGLSLGASDAAGVIRFYTNANNERVRIDATGNVGIGTTAPAYKLDVVDNTNVPVRFSRTGGDLLQLYASGGTVGNAPQLAFTVLDSAAGNPTVARLQGLATSLTSGAVTGGLEILTRNAGTQINAMSILGNGNVGIGTTSPADKLDVNGIIRVATLGTANTATHLCRNASNQLADCNTTGTGANFIQDGNSFGALATLGTNDAFGLAFETSGVEKVRIDTNGNVGIGTTAPTGKLDIASTQTTGTVNLVGAPSAVTLTGNLTGNSINLSTNYTATGFNLTGQSVNLAAVTNTGAGTYAYKGVVVSAGALSQTTAAGTNTFSGLDVTSPNLTQTTGTITANAALLTTGSITTGGTQNGLNIAAAGVTAGSLNGINISGITAGSGTETAIQIGSGWDQGLTIGVTPNATTGRTIDVAGTWGGNETDNAQTLNSTQTVNDATKALVYNLTNNKTANDTAQTVTFNLTGLPDTNGTHAIVSMRATHNASIGASAQSCVNLKVNSSANILAADLCDTAGNTQSNSNFKSFMLVRINGSWTVFSSTTQATFPTQADLAEWIEYSGDAPVAGDVLVSTGSSKVAKSTNSYDTNLIGIVSTDPHTTMGPQTDHSVRLGLAGRVPVKVASGSAAIQPGDYLTSSTEAGKAMKATHAGVTVGKALESWTPGTGKESVLVLINNTYADPNSALASLEFDGSGSLILPNANVEAEVTQLGGTPTAPKKDLSWTLGDLVKRVSKLEKDGAIASTSATLSASSSATVDNNRLDALSTQVNNLNSDLSNARSDHDQLRDRVASLAADLNLFASGSAALSQSTVASTGAELGLDKLDVKDVTVSNTLSVLGRTTLGDVGITGKLNIGLLAINGLDSDCHPELVSGSSDGCATINTASGPLRLQSDGFNGVDILGGKVVIATNGDIKVSGEITVKKLNIDTSDVASASLGEAVLPIGSTKITINTKSVTSKSKIFITPKTKTSEPLSVTGQINGQSFDIEANAALNKDIKFSWWIVN